MLVELPHSASSRFVLPVVSYCLPHRDRSVRESSIDRQVRPSPPEAGVGSLSSLERQVVQVALSDHWMTVPSERLVIRVLQRIRGGLRGLADTRLEAFRRHLVLYRYSMAGTNSEAAAISAGFSSGKLRAAEMLIDRTVAGINITDTGGS